MSLTERSVLLTRRYMPAPYLFALILTYVTALLAMFVTKQTLTSVLGHWYTGIWDILTFTCQMALILLCGHALADAPFIRSILDRVSDLPKTSVQAAILLFFVGWTASLFNWGFALVAIGFLVREVSRRLPGVSKGYLAAAAFTGNQVWASGISSSIALVTATPGSPMNFIEKMGHRLVPMMEMLWTPYNIFGVLGMALLMPILYWRIRPSPAAEPGNPVAATNEHAVSAPQEQSISAGQTPAEKIEKSPAVTVLLVAMAIGYLYSRVSSGTFNLDINMMIFFLFLLGWTLHGTPIRYMRSFHEGGRAAAPILLAFPIYGGIRGIIQETGLVDWFAGMFVAFSTAHTLPFWSYVSSNVITLFIPSGGGHWAVQGPVMVKAAMDLGADLPKTAMGVAFGEQTANLLQPFWALPVVSIGGLSVREMMGYCLMAFCVAFPLFAIALLVF